MFGWSEKKPNIGEALELKILANDTRENIVNHISKRPLRSTKRDKVRNKLLKDIARNWCRNNEIW